MPFNYELIKRHEARLHESDSTTRRALELQRLVELQKQAPNDKRYDSKREEYESLGYKFRLTDGKVYELSDGNRTCQLSIKFQVKGSVITWAFIAPRDETYQEFRDILYGAAAKAHDKVEAGCEKYYRGSDSYHLKKMHTSAQEATFNHNHYRLSNGQDVTPKEVAEHLRAFAALPHGAFFFPDLTEVDEKGSPTNKKVVSAEVEDMISKFTAYWKEWTQESKKGGALSLQKQYATERSQVVDKHDKAEEANADFQKQEPCRVVVDTLSASERAEHEVLRIQGIGSERTHGAKKHILGSPLTTHTVSAAAKPDYSYSVASTPLAVAAPALQAAKSGGGSGGAGAFTFDVKQAPVSGAGFYANTAKSGSMPNVPHLDTASTPTPKGGVAVTIVPESPGETPAVKSGLKRS